MDLTTEGENVDVTAGVFAKRCNLLVGYGDKGWFDRLLAVRTDSPDESCAEIGVEVDTG